MFSITIGPAAHCSLSCTPCVIEIITTQQPHISNSSGRQENYSTFNTHTISYCLCGLLSRAEFLHAQTQPNTVKCLLS